MYTCPFSEKASLWRPYQRLGRRDVRQVRARRCGARSQSHCPARLHTLEAKLDDAVLTLALRVPMAISAGRSDGSAGEMALLRWHLALKTGARARPLRRGT